MCHEGIRISFWYKPQKGNATIEEEYLISSGGQSAMSNGFYMRRNYGKDYDLGVAIADKLWSCNFYIMNEGTTFIAFSWSNETGLKLTVDNFEEECAPKAVERLYTFPMYDLFNNIYVGRANTYGEEPDELNMMIYNLTYRNNKTADDIPSEG